MNTRKLFALSTILVGLLMSSLSVAVAAEPVENPYKGWTGRAWVGAVCRCVEDDDITFGDATFGDVQLDVDGSAPGIGFDLEHRFNKLVGLDLAVGYTNLDIDFNHSVGEGVQQDSLGSLNIWLALNFHLVTTEKFDFWVAPQIAYVAWLNNLSFDVPGTGTFDFKTDNEFPALGLAMGADYWITKDWAANFGFRFIDADADSNHNLPIDQTFITVGLARKF